MSPIYLFTLVSLCAAAVLALLRGGPWERGTVVALVGAWGVSALTPFDHRNPAWGAVGSDILVFLFLMYGAVHTRRRWIPVGAGFQFLVLANHYIFATDARLEQWAYVSAYYVWNIGLICALCVGSLLNDRKHSL